MTRLDEIRAAWSAEERIGYRPPWHNEVTYLLRFTDPARLAREIPANLVAYGQQVDRDVLAHFILAALEAQDD